MCIRDRHRRVLDITRATSQTIESLRDLTLPAGVDVELIIGR
ncbi:MAG: uS10/mL48 family ribosomal protein, partial [Aquificaceae bacterium]|nr:uS10/mL48 family ribosomal protein [Aquificaceae bacterium]